MSGLSSPAAAKMSITPSDATARDIIWRTAKSNSSSGRDSPAARFDSAVLTVWKNPHIVSDTETSPGAARPGQRLATAPARRSGSVACRPLGSRTCSWAGGSNPNRSCALPVVHLDQSKPWKSAQHTSYFSSITATASSWFKRRLPRAPALGVGSQVPVLRSWASPR